MLPGEVAYNTYNSKIYGKTYIELQPFSERDEVVQAAWAETEAAVIEASDEQRLKDEHYGDPDN